MAKSIQATLAEVTAERDELRQHIEAMLTGWYGSAKGSGPIFAAARKRCSLWKPDIVPAPKQPKPVTETQAEEPAEEPTS